MPSERQKINKTLCRGRNEKRIRPDRSSFMNRRTPKNTNRTFEFRHRVFPDHTPVFRTKQGYLLDPRDIAKFLLSQTKYVF